MMSTIRAVYMIACLCFFVVSDGTAKQADLVRYQLTNQTANGIQTGTFSNDSHTLHVGIFLYDQVVSIPSDFNADGVVDFADFLIFAAAYGSRQTDSNFNASLDLDLNGDVGFSDFLIFAAAFGR